MKQLEFTSIGLTIAVRFNKLYVVEVERNSPAYDVRLQKDDRIDAVRSRSLLNLSIVSETELFSLFEFGNDSKISIKFFRRSGGHSYHSGVVEVCKRVEILHINDTLWEVLGLSFYQMNSDLVVSNVANDTADPNNFQKDDVIVAVDNAFVRGADDLVSKVLSCRNPVVSIRVVRSGVSKFLEVAKLQQLQSALGLERMYSIPCVGVTLKLSAGRATVESVEGQGSQVATEGVAAGWELVEVNHQKIDSLSPLEIETSLSRANLEVTFHFQSEKKKIYLWRDDLSHLQLLQAASPRLQESIIAVKEKGWLASLLGSKSDRPLASAKSLQTGMGVDRHSFASLADLINDTLISVTSRGDSLLKEIESFAGVIGEQIVGLETVHLLAQLFLVLNLFE